jgi:hypothetical protein
MSSSDTERIFTALYRGNAWGDPESRSGPGSSVLRTRFLRPRLAALLRELGVRSLLDVPCGDFNWMRHTDLGQIEYTGGDIVPELVERNSLLYAGQGRRFIRLDMLRDALPKAGLILCRDGLVHFSFSGAARALQLMKASGSTYLLATTFRDHAANEDIATGEWRPLNLERAPFFFPPPVSALEDGPRPDGSYPDKMLALYRLDAIP